MIPRGTYLGRPIGEQPKDEAEHFIKCPACGGWIDCRDLGQVFEHEGPLPHPPLADEPRTTILVACSKCEWRATGRPY